MDYHVGNIRPFVTDPLLDLARPCVGVREAARALEAKSQEGDETVVRAEETERARRGSGRLLDDAAHDRFVRRLHLASLLCLRERLEMRLHTGDLRHGGADRRLELLGDVVRLLERQVTGELHVERELLAAVDVDEREVVHLTHTRHAAD